jgi:hypothetical protein
MSALTSPTLGASRVVGTVLAGKFETARDTELPHGQTLDSARLAEGLGRKSSTSSSTRSAARRARTVCR